MSYWSCESWGNGVPPINWEAVVTTANAILDDYMDANDLDLDDADTRDFSDQLWENFCETGIVGDVVAVYEE
jgi:hypothetical protein